MSVILWCYLSRDEMHTHAHINAACICGGGASYIVVMRGWVFLDRTVVALHYVDYVTQRSNEQQTSDDGHLNSTFTSHYLPWWRRPTPQPNRRSAIPEINVPTHEMRASLRCVRNERIGHGLRRRVWNTASAKFPRALASNEFCAWFACRGFTLVFIKYNIWLKQIHT